MQKRGLSGSTLKLIAMAAMVLDHVAWCILDRAQAPVFPQPVPIGTLPFRGLLAYGFHIVGRIAFPIFLFLLSEGIRHTKSLLRYGAGLLAFAVLSELPFDLALCAGLNWQRQNVLFTLLFSMIAMQSLRSLEKRPWRAILCCLACAAAAQLLRCDYGAMGVVLACGIQLFREDRKLPGVFAVAAFLLNAPWEVTILFAIPLCMMYNGDRGLKLKYSFYAFYPVHLLVIYAISRLAGF